MKKIIIIFFLLSWIVLVTAEPTSIGGTQTDNNIDFFYEGEMNLSIIDSSINFFGTDYSAYNDRGSYSVYYKSQSSSVVSEPVRFRLGNYTLTITPNSLLFLGQTNLHKKQSFLEVVDNVGIYSGQFGEGIDLLYTYDDDRLKEELVINSLQELLTSMNKGNVAPDDIIQLKFTIKAYNLFNESDLTNIKIKGERIDFSQDLIDKSTDENIEFIDEEGNTVYYFPRPLVRDSSPCVDEDCNNQELLLNYTYDVNKYNNLVIKIQVPFSWLNSTERVYPVIIDPTIVESAPNTPWFATGRQICVDGAGIIHATWRYNDTILTYARSTDGGSSWSALNASFTNIVNKQPGIGCSGNNVAWGLTNTSGDPRIAMSTDNGATFTWYTWAASCSGDYGVLEVRGNRVYFACKDLSTDQSIDVFRGWINGTLIGTSQDVISVGGVDFNRPTMAVDGTGNDSDRIIVGAIDLTSTNDFYIADSTDSGITWNPNRTISTTNCYMGRLLTNNISTWAVCYPSSTASYNIYAWNSTTAATTWTSQTVNSTTLLNTGGRLYAPTISYNGTYDGTSGGNDVCVMWEHYNKTGILEREIVYSCKNSGGTWPSPPSVRINTGNVITGPSSISQYSDDNKIHYVYRDSTTKLIMYDYFLLGNDSAINSCTLINSSGIYNLINNLDDQSSDCINITSSNVVFNCQGYYLDGTGSGVSSGNGIRITGDNVSVNNCYLQEWHDAISINTSSKITFLDNITVTNSDLAVYKTFKDWYSTDYCTGSFFNVTRDAQEVLYYNQSNVALANRTNITQLFVCGANNFTINNWTNYPRKIQAFGTINLTITGINASEVSFDSTNTTVITNLTLTGYDKNLTPGWFYMYQGKYSNITNMTLSGGSNFLWFYYSLNISLKNILMTGNTSDDNFGAWIYHVYNSSINNLTMINNQQLLLIYVDNSNITDIVITDGYNETSFNLYRATNNIIKDVVISRAGYENRYGLLLEEYSHYNIIGNVTINNHYVGVGLGYSDNNTIVNSTIINNTIGLLVGYSSGIVNAYNNFLNNTELNILQYYPETPSDCTLNTTKVNGTRIFGLGHMIGGNYYAYPNGTGYSQTCTDNDVDGFCDNPHNITTQSSCTQDVDCDLSTTDYLPLSNNYRSDNCVNITIINPTASTINDFPVFLNVSYRDGMQSDFSNLRFYNTTCKNQNSKLLYAELERKYDDISSEEWIRTNLTPGNNIISVDYIPGLTNDYWDTAGNVWTTELTYLFNGTGKDSKTLNNGTPTTTFTDVGMIGGAAQFNGSGASVTLTNSYVFTLNNTLSFWAKINPQDYMGIVGGQLGYYAYLRFGTGAGGYDNNIYGETNTDGDGIALDFTGIYDTISTDTWYHFVIILNDTKSFILYINGQYQSATAARANENLTMKRIGEGRTGTDFFNGSMDYFSIYDSAKSSDWVNLTYQLVANYDSFISFSDYDPCSYSSGDFIIDCTNNCVFTSNIDLTTNNFFASGSGMITGLRYIINSGTGHNPAIIHLDGGCIGRW